jgi:hypothetical protein
MSTPGTFAFSAPVSTSNRQAIALFPLCYLVEPT